MMTPKLVIDHIDGHVSIEPMSPDRGWKYSRESHALIVGQMGDATWYPISNIRRWSIVRTDEEVEAQRPDVLPAGAIMVQAADLLAVLQTVVMAVDRNQTPGFPDGAFDRLWAALDIKKE
jgi:hypothetical protein